ncbi:MAG: hypothetical protein OEO23_02390 [Gemmatimonadota bacterium]|nr:hypothetical protein [Gemmatimonadota bacterium]
MSEEGSPARTPDVSGPAGSSPRPPDTPMEPIPLGQRLFDNHFLLLFLCILIMFGFFTGWGMLEIMSLEPAPLP